MENTRRHALATLLEAVANGSMSGEEALVQWGDLEDGADELLARSWHELHHVANDIDLRAQDREYDAHLRAVLRDYASQLRKTVVVE